MKTVLDTGASDNYIRPEDESFVDDVRTETGPTVMLPDSRRITSNKNARIPLSSQLSRNAQTGHVLPGLKSATLLSAGKICDDGCDIILRQNDVHVIKHSDKLDKVIKGETTVLKGTRNSYNRLWNIPVHKTTLHDNHYHTPLTHPALYHSGKKTSTRPVTLPRRHSSSPNKTLDCISSFIPEFQHSNNVIDDNEFNHLIHHQQKMDRLKTLPQSYHNPFQSLNQLIDENAASHHKIVPITHHLNIIIRKQ